MFQLKSNQIIVSMGNLGYTGAAAMMDVLFILDPNNQKAYHLLC